MIETSIPKTMSCLLSHDQQTGLWLSHCLDFDLITSGASESDAWNAMKRVVKAHVESCFADGFEEGLSKQAPISAWRDFVNHVFSGNVRSEPIQLELKKKDHQLVAFWLKGVEVESLPSRVSAGV